MPGKSIGTTTTADIMRNFRFTVEVGGSEASFAEVSGFDATYDVAEYRTGDDQFLTPRKFPGLVKYGNITMKKGIMNGDSDIATWVSECINGALTKKDITITLNDPASSDTYTWVVRNAFAVKYTGPDLNGNASEIAMETVEFAHEGITIGGVATAAGKA